MNIQGADPMQVGSVSGTLSPSVSEAQSTSDFTAVFEQALNRVNELQQHSSDLTTQFDRGDRDIALADVMIAKNQSGIAFEATLQVRNKLLEAYKELMNMPV